MKLQSLLSAIVVLAAAVPARGELLAVRVGRAETASHGAIRNAVLLIEDGKIVAIGEDLPLERGIPLVDRPDWVAMPGLVSAYTRLGLDGRAGDEFKPQVSARPEILPRADAWSDVLELGVTTLGLRPPGSGVAGQAVCVRPHGETVDEMVLSEGAYLMMTFKASAKSKKYLKDAFEAVDQYAEKLEKAREKWEKEKEKLEKKAKDAKKKDADKAEGDQEGNGKVEIPPFVPPEKPPEVAAFEAVRRGDLPMLFSVGRAVDVLHLLETLEDLDEPDLKYSLRIPSTTSLDVFYVADKIGELDTWVVMDPQVTLFPGTMRQRNVPAELVAAGAKLVFVPRSSDQLASYKRWRVDVGAMVAAGLDRQVAIQAMTSSPAEFLGLGERLGSLDEGKDANLLFLSGDPFEVSTQVEAVMLDGQFVHGEVNL